MIELIYSLALITIGFLVGMEYGEVIKITAQIIYNEIALVTESVVELNKYDFFLSTLLVDVRKHPEKLHSIEEVWDNTLLDGLDDDDIIGDDNKQIKFRDEECIINSMDPNYLNEDVFSCDLDTSNIGSTTDFEINKRFTKMYPMNAKIQGWNFEDESIKEFQPQCTFDSLLPEKCLKCKKRSKCEIDK